MRFDARRGTILAALTIVALRITADTADPSERTDTVALDDQQPDASPPQEKEPTERPNPFRDPRDRVFYPGDTEKLKPLVEKLGGNLLLDQKEIWTSPFQ